jgi:DsbC/DsbD-like thiol-disulfide interchange protein
MRREFCFSGTNKVTKRALLCATVVLSLAPLQLHSAIAGSGYSGSVVLTEFGSAVDGVTVKADDVQAKITLSGTRIYSGQQLHVQVEFAIEPGWHIYGQPLPEGYTPTSVKFDDALISSQALAFPRPTPVKFEVLGETLPVYQGDFKASGMLRLKQKLPPGDHTITGTLEFQECNDTLCKMPRTVRFEIPIRIETLVPAAPKQ